MKNKHLLIAGSIAVLAYVLWHKCKKKKCNCAPCSAKAAVPSQTAPVAVSVPVVKEKPETQAPKVITIETVSEVPPPKYKAVIDGTGYYYYVDNGGYSRHSEFMPERKESVSEADYKYVWKNFKI